jgi:UPF0176 protein
MGDEFTIITFYKFVHLPKFKSMYTEIKDFCLSHGIRGTILLAEEGINSTISGSDPSIKATLNFLTSYPELNGLHPKVSYHNKHPFIRLKIKLKKEIVTLGINNINPANKVGKYIEPQDWNELISNPNVITIDTRNKYETKIGTFRHAIDPKINTFRQFPKFFEENFNKLSKDTKIAMYCTGGIRCEKSTAYLLQLGFKNVYHLNGGILNYLDKISAKDSLWKGECFIFDNRIGLDQNSHKGKHIMCPGCRYPVSPEEQLSEKYQLGVRCPSCFDVIPEKTVKRAKARHKQLILIKKNNHTVCS